MSSRNLSRNSKLILYKTLILPLLPYGTVAGVLLNNDAAFFGVFERKVPHKTFGLVRLRSSSDLYKLLNDINVCSHGSVKNFEWWKMHGRGAYLIGGPM